MNTTSLSLLTALASAAMLPAVANAQAAAPAAVAPAAAVPQSQILIIDLERVFAGSLAGKSGDAQLKTKLTAMQARAKQLQDALTLESDALRKQQAANAIAPEALQAKARDLGQREQAGNAELATRQQEFQNSQRYVQQQILSAVGPIVQQIMKERGSQVALRADATLAMNPALDATAEVVRRLDASLKTVGVNPPAAPAPAK